MKKIKNLLYALTAFLLIIGLMSLHSCTDKSGTSNQNVVGPSGKSGPIGQAGQVGAKGDAIAGHIALAATQENKMGIVLVHGWDNGTDHPLAYGIPYHFNDVVDAAQKLPLQGDNIQFTLQDDGKFYTALKVKKVGTHSHSNNILLDSTRMIALDDHKIPSFIIDLNDVSGQGGPQGQNGPKGPKDPNNPNPDPDGPLKSHVLGHIGPPLGMATLPSTNPGNGNNTNDTKAKTSLLSNTRSYEIYPIIVKKDDGNDTTYVGFPFKLDRLISSDAAMLNQVYYIRLSDVNLSWSKKNEAQLDKINNRKPIKLMREIEPYHWHWYEKANSPQ